LINKANLILFASSNNGKIKEVVAELSKAGVAVIAPVDLTGPLHRDYGFDEPLKDEPEVAESADTYLGNAKLKAEAYFSWCGLPSLADDSGLEVDALNGQPGIFSSRYAGEDCSTKNNITKLLKALEGNKQRSARFRSVLYLKFDQQKFTVVEGVLEGSIASEQRGSGGFGYDSIFVVEGSGKTLAELKSSGSFTDTHRHRALAKILHQIP